MKRIVLCPNMARDEGLAFTRRVRDMLTEAGCEVVVSPIYGEATELPTAELSEALRGAGLLVTLGGDGAVPLDENGVFHERAAFRGVPVNTVGAGDSTVAGFLAKAEKGCADFGEILTFACAAGAATAFSEGLATADMIERVLTQTTRKADI